VAVVLSADAMHAVGVFFDTVTGDLAGRRIVVNGAKAAEKFIQVEKLIAANGCSAPFTWIFMRPPWATTGACCKECVYHEMNMYAAKVSEDAVTCIHFVWVVMGKIKQRITKTSKQCSGFILHVVIAMSYAIGWSCIANSSEYIYIL